MLAASARKAVTDFESALGQTRLGMIRPEAMLAGLSADPSLQEVAREVETSTTAIIEAAAA
jgi:hypothetical protein